MIDRDELRSLLERVGGGEDEVPTVSAAPRRLPWLQTLAPQLAWPDSFRGPGRVASFKSRPVGYIRLSIKSVWIPLKEGRAASMLWPRPAQH